MKHRNMGFEIHPIIKLFRTSPVAAIDNGKNIRTRNADDVFGQAVAIIKPLDRCRLCHGHPAHAKWQLHAPVMEAAGTALNKISQERKLINCIMERVPGSSSSSSSSVEVPRSSPPGSPGGMISFNQEFSVDTITDANREDFQSHHCLVRAVINWQLLGS